MKTRRLVIPLLLASSLLGHAAEVIYQPVQNPATVPTPKDDWFVTVQGKFTRYGDKPADIVFDGDSITNRWEVAGKEMWARYADRAADFGIEGDRTENLLWRLQKGQLDGVNPKLVVLMIGTNNVARGNTAEQIAAGIKEIVNAYKTRCPQAHIVIMAVFPRGKTSADPARQKVEAINTIIKSLDDGDRVSFVDIGPKMIETDGTLAPEMAPDALHPTAKGYVIWADAIQPFVDKYAPKG